MWRNSYERRRGYGGGWAQGGRRPFRRGGYNRDPSSWKNRQGGGRSAPAWKQAPRFTEAKSGNKRPLSQRTEIQAKKRQKSNHCQLKLTTIILARVGNNEGELPELVSSRFYDCTREAEIGKDKYFLRINISRKGGKKEFEDEEYSSDDRISVPVPLDSIEGISVLSGMNPSEKLLKAYSDRFALKASIEHWTRIITKRTETHLKNLEKLQELLEVEDIPEIWPEAETNDPEADVEDENEPEVDDENEGEDEGIEPEATDEVDIVSHDQELDSDDEERKKAEQEEEKRKQEEKDRKAKAISEAKKKRELALRKRNTLEILVEKLSASVEKAKENLSNEKQKLEDLVMDFGHYLAYFEDGVDGDEAMIYFQDGLTRTEESKSGDEEIEEIEKAEVEVDEPMNEEEGKEAMDEDNLDDEGKKATDDEAVENEAEVKEPGACHECGESGAVKYKFCNKCGAKQKAKKTPEPESGEITEVPVWISILLKKPLEKFYASAVQNSICEKDVLEKVSLILLKYHPKHKSKIVLKNVTYKGAEEDLKDLNQVVKLPWKSICKKPTELLDGKSPYSIEKVVQYLAKTHQRQKVLDTTVDNCTLCETPIKRMFLDKHMTQFCQKRHEPCDYCFEPFVVESMKNHQETECPKVPVRCPLKCYTKYPRCMVEEHQTTCKNAIVQCEFSSFGCHIDLKRKQVTRHMKEAGVDHVKLLKARLDLLMGYLGENDEALMELLYHEPVAEEENENDEVENEADERFAGDN